MLFDNFEGFHYFVLVDSIFPEHRYSNNFLAEQIKADSEYGVIPEPLSAFYLRYHISRYSSATHSISTLAFSAKPAVAYALRAGGVSKNDK